MWIEGKTKTTCKFCSSDRKERVLSSCDRSWKVVLFRQKLIKLKRPLKEKRPGYTRSFFKMTMFDHVVKCVNNNWENVKWNVLLHPPYSPDLVPSKYHWFRLRQHRRSEQQFPFLRRRKNLALRMVGLKTRKVILTRNPFFERKMGRVIANTNTLVIKLIHFVMEINAYILQTTILFGLKYRTALV